VQAKSGDRYLVTASHLYKATEWPTMRTITLRTMEGEIVGQCKGAPLYVGKYTEETSLSKVRERDYSEDLMICLWPGKSTAKPLQLAANLPKKDELVWAVGCDRDNPGA
jgi:hypothetical protein